MAPPLSGPDQETAATTHPPRPGTMRRLLGAFEAAKLDSGEVAGRKGENAIDWWSLPHFASGLLLGLLPLGWGWAFLVIVGYEVLEAGLRRIKTKDGGLFEYESWRNIFVDVILGLTGYAIMHLAVFPFLDWPSGWWDAFA